MRDDIYSESAASPTQCAPTLTVAYPLLTKWPDEIPDGSVWEWTSQDFDPTDGNTCVAVMFMGVGGKLKRVGAQSPAIGSWAWFDGDTIQRIS